MMYLYSEFLMSTCSESSLVAIKPKVENVRSPCCYLYIHHISTDAVEAPGQVGNDCTFGQTYSGVGLKSKRQHTWKWSAAVWPPRGVIAQQYSPAPSASVCFYSRKNEMWAPFKIWFYFFCFLKLRKSTFILSKSTLTSLYIFWEGLVPCGTS
jgi:hypothetical protein